MQCSPRFRRSGSQTRSDRAESMCRTLLLDLALVIAVLPATLALTQDWYVDIQRAQLRNGPRNLRPTRSATSWTP